MSRIVVGVDGSEDSHRALAWAAEEARHRGATLHIVYSWTFPDVAMRIDPGGEPPAVDLAKEAAAVVEEALATVDVSGIEVKREVCNENAATGLIHASEGADMIVIGSRGLGGFRGLLLGSVGNQVAQHAHCPVVIVPHPDRR